MGCCSMTMGLHALELLVLATLLALTAGAGHQEGTAGTAIIEPLAVTIAGCPTGFTCFETGNETAFLSALARATRASKLGMIGSSLSPFALVGTGTLNVVAGQVVLMHGSVALHSSPPLLVATQTNGDAVRSSSCKGNLVQIKGGALNATNVSFIGGQATAGAAVCLDGAHDGCNPQCSTFNGVDCTFLNNTASAFGGAVYSNGANLNVRQAHDAIKTQNVPCQLASPTN
jgi:predicted outer membrane repeat protein